MLRFNELSKSFESYFSSKEHHDNAVTLYKATRHILDIPGKRVRPVAVLLANELFQPAEQDAYYAAAAIELFHNFSLVHDDIMDKAPLRRGRPTVHEKFGNATAILAGDLLLVEAYEQLARVKPTKLKSLIQIFNKAAREVCEGQQMDMDFQDVETVSLNEYLEMITLKTSVLLAASMKMGAYLGGASIGAQESLYEFGKNLGIAFQIQDDYLDAYGDPAKTGKQPGGDILENKKTFLLLYAQADADERQSKQLAEITQLQGKEKISRMLQLYSETGAKDRTHQLKQQYYQQTLQALEHIPVVSERKVHLYELAESLLNRDF